MLAAASPNIGGQSRNRVAKLAGNGTGAADANWNPSADDGVSALAVDASGAVYASGYFTNIGGQSRNGIAKLSGTGTGAADPIWDPFHDLLIPSFLVHVDALAIDASGAVYAGGYFSFAGSNGSHTNIAKLSGSGTGEDDPNWHPSANNIYALAVDAGGKVHAGGDSTYFIESPELIFANGFDSVP